MRKRLRWVAVFWAVPWSGRCTSGWLCRELCVPGMLCSFAVLSDASGCVVVCMCLVIFVIVGFAFTAFCFCLPVLGVFGVGLVVMLPALW